MKLVKTLIQQSIGTQWSDLQRYEEGSYSRLTGFDFEGAVYLDRMRAVYDGTEFDWHGGGAAYTKSGFRLDEDERIEKIRVDFATDKRFIYNLYFDTNKRDNLGFSSYYPDVPRSEIVHKEYAVDKGFELACLEGGAEICTDNRCISGLTIYCRELDSAGEFNVIEADTDTSTLMFISQENSTKPALQEVITEKYQFVVQEDTVILTAILYSGDGRSVELEAPVSMRVIDPEGREIMPSVISDTDYIYLDENGETHGIILTNPMEGTWEVVIDAAAGREFRCSFFLYSMEDDVDGLLKNLKKIFPGESEDALKERLILPLILNIGSIQDTDLSGEDGQDIEIAPYKWWKICDMVLKYGPLLLYVLILLFGAYWIYKMYQKKKLEEILKKFSRPYRVEGRKRYMQKKFWKEIENMVFPIVEKAGAEEVLENRRNTKIVDRGFNDSGFVVDRDTYEKIYCAMQTGNIYLNKKEPDQYNPAGKHLEVDLGGEGRFNDIINDKSLKCGFRRALNLNSRLHNYYNKAGIPLLIYTKDFRYKFPFADKCVDIFYKQGVGYLYKVEADEIVRCLKDGGMILCIDYACKKNVPVKAPLISGKDWEDPYNPGLSDDYQKYSDESLADYLDEDLLAIYCYIADNLVMDMWLIGNPESEDRNSVLVCIK